MKQALTTEMRDLFAPLREWAKEDSSRTLVILASDRKEHSVNIQGNMLEMSTLFANAFESDADLLKSALLGIMAINTKEDGQSR